MRNSLFRKFKKDKIKLPKKQYLKEYKADYENGKSCHEIMSMILQKIRYSPKQDERLEFVDNKIKIYI